MSDWHYSKYESLQERKNMFKGFISLIIISGLIVGIIALLVFVVVIFKTHPEYFEPTSSLFYRFKQSIPSDFI